MWWVPARLALWSGAAAPLFDAMTPMMKQTLALRMLTLCFSVLFLLLLVVVRRLEKPDWKPCLVCFGFGILLLAWVLRWVTPDMAFNSIVRPDGVHFSVTAQELVAHHRLAVPTDNSMLPPRTLPGVSFLMAATQWLNPAHPGFGIFPIWICAGLSIWLAFYLGRRLYNPLAGWLAALMVALSPSLAWYARQLMSEVPWGLLVLAGGGLLAFSLQRPGRALLAGVITGLGLLIKSSHILVMIGFAVALLLWTLRRRAIRPSVLFTFLAGLLIGAAPAFLYNRLVLGGWTQTAYHIYWPGWAEATTALNIRYLFGPPLIPSFFGMGNVPYYILSLFGVDPRPERMIFAPVVFIFIIYFLCRKWRAARGRTADEKAAAAPSDPARLFQSLAWWAGGLYIIGCLLYSFQEPRFLLPVVPLLMTAFSGALADGIRATRSARWLGEKGALITLCILLGLGLGILRVETEPTLRRSDRAMLAQLAAAAEPYDILVSDEDPVLLTLFGVWSGTTQVLPMLLPGELWFPKDPAALYREKHQAVEPFTGTVPLVGAALDEGQTVAAYIRRSRARPEAWAALNAAFLLTPVESSGLRNFFVITRRPVFYLGAIMPREAMAYNRSQPLSPFEPAPFELARTEMDHAVFVEFLNDAWKAHRLAVEETDNELIINLKNPLLPLCTIRPTDQNCGLRYDAENVAAPFYIATDMPQPMNRRPVAYVSWYGAAAACNWLSRRDGLPEAYTFRPGMEPATAVVRTDGPGWRLPLEGEWEWAATWNGEEKRIYVWGNDWTPEYANLYDSPTGPNNGIDPFTLPVDELPPWAPADAPPPAYHHLAGNVWEWCDDWFADYDKPDEPADMKVLRGGSYRTGQDAAWAAFRGLALPESMTPDIGFRPARTLP